MSDPDLGTLLGRRLSTEIVLLHSVIGDHLGLSARDHRYLDVLARGGPMTAQQLGEATGLSSGSVTALVDRLIDQGFVERRPDADDRRRVIITASGPRMAAFGPLFAGLGQRFAPHLAEFSVKERKVVARFLEALVNTVREHREALERSDHHP